MTDDFNLSQEEHLKEYPNGYELIFETPVKIEIFWKEREEIEDGKANGVIRQAQIEEDEVIEIHLWKDRFYPYEWNIAFEQEQQGRVIDFKRINGWRFKQESGEKLI